MTDPGLRKKLVLNAVTRSGLHRVFRSGLRGRVLVLKYHHIVSEEGDGWFDFEQGISPDLFRRQMRVLSERCRVVPLDSLVDGTNSSDDARPLAVLTFDDGYLDNFQHALPALQEFGLTATFFLATAYLGTGVTYPKNRVKALLRADGPRLERLVADDLGLRREPWEVDEAFVGRLGNEVSLGRSPGETDSMLGRWEEVIGETAERHPVFAVMGEEQARVLHAGGMTVGAHTISHRRLVGLSREDVLEEVRGGRKKLEAVIRAPVTCFAYPDGRMDEVSVPVVKESFAIACTSETGYDRLPLALPHLLKRASPPGYLPSFEALASGLSPWWGTMKARIPLLA